MSYNTDYAIRVHGDLDNRSPGDMTGRRPPSLASLAAELEQHSDEQDFDVYYPDHHSHDGVRKGGPFIALHGRWYDMEQDMRALSARYPHVDFWVLGMGDDALYGDVWCQKFAMGHASQKDYHWDMLWGVDVRKLGMTDRKEDS